MIRAALALYEATGEQRLSRPGARLAARARPRTTPMPRPAAIILTADDAEGLVVRPAATSDDATPNHNAHRGAEPRSGWRRSPATIRWRAKADRLIAAIAPQAVENLFMHMALLNAVDLRLRAAEIVVTGEGARAEALARSGEGAAAARSHRAARALNCRI